MTIPLNYNDIILAVQEELEDTGTEFTANIPTAIRLAEERINREIDTLGLHFTATTAMTASNRVVAKPTGHKLTFSISYQSSGRNVLLEKKTLTYLNDFWPQQTSVAPPEYYTDLSNTQILVAPTPDDAYTVTWDYLKKPDALSSTNQTNYYTDYIPDTLYYAVLVEQTRFAKMYESMAVYDAAYQRSLTGVNEEGRRQRTDDTSPVDAPIVELNTLGRKP